MTTPCPATIEAMGKLRTCGYPEQGHPKQHSDGVITWSDPDTITVVRLRCHNCDRFMPPDLQHDDSTIPPTRLPVEHYGYQGNDLFCTMRCGFQWAVRALSHQDIEISEGDD